MAALSGCEKSCRGIGQLFAPISRIVGPQLASVNTIRVRLGHESLGRDPGLAQGQGRRVCPTNLCQSFKRHTHEERQGRVPEELLFLARYGQ